MHCRTSVADVSTVNSTICAQPGLSREILAKRVVPYRQKRFLLNTSTRNRRCTAYFKSGLQLGSHLSGVYCLCIITDTQLHTVAVTCKQPIGCKQTRQHHAPCQGHWQVANVHDSWATTSNDAEHAAEQQPMLQYLSPSHSTMYLQVGFRI